MTISNQRNRATALIFAAATVLPAAGLACFSFIPVAMAQEADDPFATSQTDDQNVFSTAPMTQPGRTTQTTSAATATEDEAGVPVPGQDPTSNTTLADPNLSLTGKTLAEEGEPASLRDNLRESSVDGLSLKPAKDRDEAPGIDLGGFVFRPAITEQIGAERAHDKAGTTTRTFLDSGLKGSLTSDWASHELLVNGEINKRKTFSGTTDDDPTYKLDATLKLDLIDDTVASLKAGFNRERETATATNAVPGASVQATVTTWSTGTELIHDFGRIRATLAADVERQTFGAAIDSKGKLVSQAARDNTTPTLRARLGYEMSPALIPFIEASYAQMIHDKTCGCDISNRNMSTIGAASGVALDLGDKLRGELAGGYSLSQFEDSRLSDIAAITINGNATWSPIRGTDVLLGVETAVEPSTLDGVNGSVSYTLRGEIDHKVLNNLTARTTLATTWRNFDSSVQGDQTVIVTGAGLTWGLSRYLDLTGDAQWEITRDKQSGTSTVTRGLVGLVLKR